MKRVEVRNCHGSVEHYFHFLLGFCVPLVHFHLSAERPSEAIPLAVRECGPLTPLIAELHLNLRAQPLEEFRQSQGEPPLAVLAGYDSVDRYERPVFDEFKSYVATLASQHASPRKRPATVLIERGPAPAFFMSKSAEIGGWGTSRRAIGNHGELRSALAQRMSQLQNIQLEGRSLLDQFALFQSTDILIAQHGAALANVIFMRSGSHVIEILPKDQALGRDLFAALARTMDVGYTVVDQDGGFAPVDIGAVLEAIPKRQRARKGLMTSRPIRSTISA